MGTTLSYLTLFSLLKCWVKFVKQKLTAKCSPKSKCCFVHSFIPTVLHGKEVLPKPQILDNKMQSFCSSNCPHVLIWKIWATYILGNQDRIALISIGCDDLKDKANTAKSVWVASGILNK